MILQHTGGCEPQITVRNLGQCMLDSALGGEVARIVRTNSSSSMRNLQIPREPAESWRLDKCLEVNVQWQIVNDTHPQAFAPMAKNTDDGGIGVFKTIDGVVHNHWINPHNARPN